MSASSEVFEEINESLARIRQFRPLWKDDYSLGPVLSLEEVENFERAHFCRLPQDYREFLMRVGNGGAGPEWGLSALGQHFPDSGHEECLEDDPDLSRPFPHREAWNAIPDSRESEEELYFRPTHAVGSMTINDRGCALSTRIVVTGPLAGEIWCDDRADGGGIHPHLAPDGSHYQFLPWYRDWLSRRMHQYGHKGNPRPDPGPGEAD
jgi:hypothetical protein